MPVTRLTKGEPTPPSRWHWSALYDTQEWKDAIKELDKTLSKGEKLCVTFSKETVEQLDYASKKSFIYSVVQLFQRYIEKNYRIPYRVYSRTDGDEKLIFIEREP